MDLVGYKQNKMEENMGALGWVMDVQKLQGKESGNRGSQFIHV